MRRYKEKPIKLGKIKNGSWESKDGTLWWEFCSIMPILIRDALLKLAVNTNNCPMRFADAHNGDVEAGCEEWSDLLKCIANKFGYYTQNSFYLLSKEDQEKVTEYLHQRTFEINEKGQRVWPKIETPEYIQKIWDKEEKIKEDQENALKEGLIMLSDIWGDLWD